MPNRRAHDHIGNFNFMVEVEGVTQGADRTNAITLQPQSDGDMVIADASGNYLISGVGNDALLLEGKLSPTDIWFHRQGDDLAISIDGSDQVLLVANWFTGKKAMIESITAGSYRLDGETLTQALTLQDDVERVVPDLWYQAF
ncbi:MAG: hypothetical protein AB8B96_01715 [Lysobacterales bacterium]